VMPKSHQRRLGLEVLRHSLLDAHLCRRIMRRRPASALGDAADGAAVPPTPPASKKLL
jgi:hypothetical protein